MTGPKISHFQGFTVLSQCSRDDELKLATFRLPINFELYWGQFCALKIEARPKKGP